MMNDLMFEINTALSSVLMGWFDDKVLAGYNRIEEIKGYYEEVADSGEVSSSEKFELEGMVENLEKAFLVRYDFIKVTDASLGKYFETKKYREFLNEHVWNVN